MRHGYPKGTGITFVNQWAFVIFLNAADCKLLSRLSPLPLTVISIIVVMIVRVYAMWNQSKRILYLLLFIYVPQIIISIVFTAVYNTSTYLSGASQINLTCHSNLIQVVLHLPLPSCAVTITQVMGFSACNPGWKNIPSKLQVYQVIPRFILGALLLILAVTQTLKSVNVYEGKKGWQLNRYMEQLVKDGILYFLVYVSVPPVAVECSPLVF